MPRSIEDMVNEQIARWRIELSRPRVSPADRDIPVAVTIAHAVGSNGTGITNRIGALLDLPVYDRQIVEHIASKSGVRTETVECLDERGRGLLEDFLSSLFRERGFHQSDYLHHVTEAILALWQHGPCVMVGHGCVHLVPREHALAVRLTAAVQVRVHRVSEREPCDAIEAGRKVRRTDDERAAFHRRHFGAEADNPLLYDVVLDTSMLGTDACAAIIVEAFRQKFAAAATLTRRAVAETTSALSQPR